MQMKKPFAPNLESEGRWARGITALILGGAALVVLPFARRLSVLLGVGALFVLFEAARGWCVLRACGIKTKV